MKSQNRAVAKASGDTEGRGAANFLGSRAGWLVMLCLLLAGTAGGQQFGGTVYIDSYAYDYISSEVNGDMQTDLYSYGMSISAPITNNGGLGKVEGSLSGYLLYGTFHPYSFTEQGNGGSMGPFSFETSSYSTTSWIDTSNWTLRTSGGTYYVGTAGSGSDYFDGYGNSTYSYAGSLSYETPVAGLTFELFGLLFEYQSGSFYAEGSGATYQGLSQFSTFTSYSSTYFGPDNSYVNVANNESSSDSGPASWTSWNGWDPYLGSFTSDGTTYEFQARAEQSFSVADLMVNGELMSWTSGEVDSAGTVADHYAGEDGTLTIAGNLRAYTLDQASVTVTVSGVGTGTLSPVAGFEVQGAEILPGAWTESSTPHYSEEELWVNGTPYQFAAGYQDLGGTRVDRYTNPSGGTVALTGQMSDASEAAVRAQHGGVHYTGTFEDGAFNVTGVFVTTIAPLELAEVFWCGGKVYERVPFLNDYTTAGEAWMLSFSSGSGTEIDVQLTRGADVFAGTYEPAAGGVFALTGTAGLVVACAVDETGALIRAGGTLPADHPPAVLMSQAVWHFMGVAAAEGGGTAAYYCWIGSAEANEEILTIKAGAVARKNVVTGAVKSGSYDVASHLFQASLTNGLPVPVLGVDSTSNDVLWGLEPPEDSDLPSSFVVNGQVWRYAGMDGDEAVYRGYYEGQGITVGAAGLDEMRQVELVDSVNGNSHGTLNLTRNSVRLRDGTMLYFGDFEGVRDMPESVGNSLQTLAGDLDFTGNVLSWGSLTNDAGTAGVVMQFHDEEGTATLASSLGRWEAQWAWYRAAEQEGGAPEAMMVLDSGNRLRLQDPEAPNDPPGVMLDPAAEGMSRFKGHVTVDGVLIITSPAGGISMGDFE